MATKKLQVWIPLLFSMVMIAGMLVGYKIKGNMPGRDLFYTIRQKPVQEVINLIENKYVDKVNMDSLTSNTVGNMLSRLDPHSIFLPANELQDMKEDMEGKFYGIGIEYNIFNDTIYVLNVLKGGPADKAGLQVGDKFIKAGDSEIAGVKITPANIKQLLRGDAGTKAEITVMRGKELKNFTIIRGAIPLYSLDAAYIIHGNTGYIRLNKFSDNTYKEFMTAMEKLKKEGMQSLVLDLRDNGGGILSEATNIADEFLDDDKMITYTVGEHSPRKEYHAQREGIFESGKLMVLADEGTASASEVLIGALQDWDRATIIGRRTFGKGLVQEQYELSDGSGLRLTVARYYTPLGRSIQKSYSNGNEAYQQELTGRFHDGELLYADSIKHTNGKPYKTKNGKVVYSGGGITPDIFVAFDTSSVSKEMTRAYIKGTINNFVYQNYINNKNAFSTFRSPSEFEKNYSIDDVTWDRFKKFAFKDSLDLSNLSDRDKVELVKQLKVITARQIWRSEGLYEVSNANDLMVKRALEEIEHSK
ncbi:MAG: S41 family peptidase [Ginsengibacter sp.]